MKKQVNLKKRLDDLRQDPDPPVKITLEVDAPLYRMLTTFADANREPVNVFLLRVLR